LETRFTDRDMLCNLLPSALLAKEIEVYLQPRIALRKGLVSGFEALARWNLDGRVLAGDEIVSVAEQSGVVVELDRLMIDEAIRLVASWNRVRRTTFGLSVNISSEFFLEQDAVSTIQKSLQQHGFAPSDLTVEVSQTGVLTGNYQTGAALRTLRAIGCRLSIDDFGFGSSSLADLQALPADEIKLDPVLLRDLDASESSTVILTALLQMASKLKIDTVVEGVERNEQADAIREIGYPLAQGFLFGEPRPAAEWLADATYGNTPTTFEKTD
ncbi:MAG: EAL domain-containing protein, partial [Pseudomonadota bacterium]